MAISQWMRRGILDYVYRAATWTLPANWHLGLYTGDPEAGGAEVQTSAWSNYGRVALPRAAGTFDAAASEAAGGGDFVQNAGLVDFGTATVPGAGVDLGWWALHDASTGGNRGHSGPLGGPPRFFAGVASTDTIHCPGHGLANGNVVVLIAGGLTLPGGLTAGTAYFVVGATTNTLQLSLTSGGVAIDITTDGAGSLQRWLRQTVQDQNPVSVAIGALDLILRP